MRPRTSFLTCSPNPAHSYGLVPQIRAAADHIERNRRLPQPLVQAMAEAGLFRMLVPAKFGGGEVDPITALRVIEEVARADGSAGWIVMNGAGAGLFTSYLDDEGIYEIHGQDPLVILAGSGEPRGQAVVTEGGYRVTGRWPRASGIDLCTWAWGNCTILEDDQPRRLPNGLPDLRTLYFPTGDIQIIDTWYASGLRGTCSNDFVVTDLFVPARRSMTTVLYNPPPSQPGLLYAFPPLSMSALVVGACALGLARGAIDALIDLAGRKVPAGSRRLLAERTLAQMSVAQAEGAVRTGRAFLFETVRDLWDTLLAGREIILEQRASLRLAATQATINAAQAIDLMYNAGGASSVYDTSPLQRCFRDIHAVTQQILVTPPTYELIGQAFLGVNTDKLRL